MLGVPPASHATLAALVLAGIVVAAAAFVPLRARLGAAPPGKAALAAALVTVAAVPYAGWRIVEAVRFAHGLDAYERAAAGPIQAYLPGYLADGVARVVPRNATYATVVGDAVPYSTAQKAFPALVLDAAFPRVSAPPARAGWIVAWGAPPRRAAPVQRPVVVHPRQGNLPPVVVARAAR